MRTVAALVVLLSACVATVAGAAQGETPASDAHGTQDAHADEIGVHGDPVAGYGDHVETGVHGEHEHGGKKSKSMAAVLVNTFLFFGVLGWFIGPWLVAWFRKRKARIADDLSAAERAREEARQRLAEAEQRLREVEGEVAAILANAEKQADAERDRILASAQSEAERIVRQARTQVAELEQQAEYRLRELAADVAVVRARGLVSEKLSDRDRDRLFDDYVEGMKKAAG